MTATVELVAAVREFLSGLTLTGREAFHAKVAANALAIVERELAGDAAAVEAASLLPFTSSPRRKPGSGWGAAEKSVEGAVGEATRQSEREPTPGFRRGDGEEVRERRVEVCAAIRSGALVVTTPGLLDALVAATCARLAVDNPRYPTLARLATDAAVRR